MKHPKIFFPLLLLAVFMDYSTIHATVSSPVVSCSATLEAWLIDRNLRDYARGCSCRSENEQPVCDSPSGDGGDNSGNHGSPEPAGPTPAQLEQKRANALKAANERGYSCYDRKDWNCAIRYFQEALSYAPYNPTLQYNLRRAREQADRQGGTAGHQLQSAVHHGNQAIQSGNAGSQRELGGQVFDSKGNNVGGLKPPVVYSQATFYREPVVTAANRTPAIAKFEKERETSKKKRAELETRLNQLQREPHRNQVEVANVKQEIATTRNQENFLNFSIEVELKKAPDAKK